MNDMNPQHVSAAPGAVSPLLVRTAGNAIATRASSRSLVQRGLSALEADAQVPYVYTAEQRQGGHGYAFSPDGLWLHTGLKDAVSRLWDVSTGSEIFAAGGEQAWHSSLKFASNGEWFAAVSADSIVRIWSVTSRSVVHAFPTMRSLLAISPDGQWLAGSKSTSCEVVLWNAYTGHEVRSLVANDKPPLVACSFSPDGRFLGTVTVGGVARIWTIESGRETSGFLHHQNPGEMLFGCRFSPDGKWFVTDGLDFMEAFAGGGVKNVVLKNFVRILDVGSGSDSFIYEGCGIKRVRTGCFSPDGRWRVTVLRNDTAQLRDIAARSDVPLFDGHADQVGVCGFSPNGLSLAAGLKDGTIRVWDVAAAQQVATLVGHTGDVLSCAFSPDSKSLATGSADGTARLWDVATARCTRTWAFGLGSGVGADWATWDNRGNWQGKGEILNQILTVDPVTKPPRSVQEAERVDWQPRRMSMSELTHKKVTP